MSRRAVVEPRWLDSMLISWGRNLPSARGWYSVCPMLMSGIPSTAKHYEPWDIQPRDFDDLCKAIDALEPKFRCVIYVAYKPWATEMRERLESYGVSLRTRQRWLHEAASVLASEMSRRREWEAA